jgi:hypothetical protein
MKYQGAVLGIIALVIVSAVAYPIAYYSQSETTKVTITGKEHINKMTSVGGSESYYRIYTNNGTYKLEESLILWKFNTSDDYGRLRIDSTYTIDAVGFRAAYISEYPNITDIQFD